MQTPTIYKCVNQDSTSAVQWVKSYRTPKQEVHIFEHLWMHFVLDLMQFGFTMYRKVDLFVLEPSTISHDWMLLWADFELCFVLD